MTLILYSLATVAQLLAVYVAFTQFKVVKYFRYGWICLFIGLFLMLARRVPQVLTTLLDGKSNLLDSSLAFVISTLLLVGVIGMKELFIRLNEHRADLDKLTKFDLLTGAATRHSIIEQGLSEVERCSRLGRPFALLMLDIDHFKSVNDSYGHLAGDEVLKNVVNACKASLRGIDLFGRFGGEEFLAVLPEATLEEATIVANRINKAVESTSTVYKNHKLAVTISIGIASFNQSATERYENVASRHIWDDLMSQADLALYQAKKIGRNNAQVHAPAPNGEDSTATREAIRLNSVLTSDLDDSGIYS